MKELITQLYLTQLYAAPWTVAHQAPLPLKLSRQHTGVGCHSLLPGTLPDPRIEPVSPTLWAGSLPSESPGKPRVELTLQNLCSVGITIKTSFSGHWVFRSQSEKTSGLSSFSLLPWKEVLVMAEIFMSYIPPWVLLSSEAFIHNHSVVAIHSLNKSFSSSFTVPRDGQEEQEKRTAFAN